jgi:signal transduction histidine kinase
MEAGLKGLRSFDYVHRVVRLDGLVRFVHSQGERVTNDQGQVVRFVGTVLDVTEQKLAEKALASVTRRLFEAQDQERARIARELHDDVNQRLAMLTIHLGQVQGDYPDLPAEVIRRIADLKKESAEISTDIQSLSHELHLAKLEYLGITTAMKAFCKEFGAQQRVAIDFEIHEVPIDLPPDASLCLFRVLQEALHNSVKHSGVRHFEVRLREMSDEVHLTVRDWGAGFDAMAAKESRGLGLVSMEERLKLVNGTFSIESQPHRGTTVHARVPIQRTSDSIEAAG